MLKVHRTNKLLQSRFSSLVLFLLTAFALHIIFWLHCLCLILTLLCLTEIELLVKNLQLLSRCEMCDKNKVLLLPGALGQCTGHLRAMPKQSGILCPVQGQLNNRCRGRKEAFLLADLGIQPSNLTVVKLHLLHLPKLEPAAVCW